MAVLKTSIDLRSVANYAETITGYQEMPMNLEEEISGKSNPSNRPSALLTDASMYRPGSGNNRYISSRRKYNAGD